MPSIPDIGINAIEIREIPAWQVMPPRSIPQAPPVTLHLGFPIADVPGCVESRDAQPGNKDAYDNDPRGNLVICDGQMPSYKPLDFTPGTLTYGAKKAPTPDVQTKKTAGVSSQPQQQSPSPSSDSLDLPKVVTELPCPPPDAIPLGAKNKSQTAVVIGYEMVDGKCTTMYEKLDVPTIIGNYLPGAPVVTTTAAVATVATTAAIFAKPLGDLLLRAVKPIVNRTIKNIMERLGKGVPVQSVSERRISQRALRR